jgi:hypothetical protein
MNNYENMLHNMLLILSIQKEIASFLAMTESKHTV